MCLSYVGKLIYFFLMLVILIATAFAYFTPGWRHFTKIGTDETGNVGLSRGCEFPDMKNATCTLWWAKRPDWEKFCQAFFALAMALEVIAMGWVGLSYIACCFHKKFMHVLPFWSLLLTLSLSAGIAIFYAKYQSDAELITDSVVYRNLDPGYSASVMSGATLLAFVSIFIAVSTSFFADRTCC